MMRYWFGGQYRAYTFGEFRDGYGVKQIREEYYNLSDHQNNKGHWIKDPKQTQINKEKRITRAIVEDALELTVNEVIEKQKQEIKDAFRQEFDSENNSNLDLEKTPDYNNIIEWEDDEHLF